MKNAIPVTVLSGFLGAGKTTLLNHLLHEEHGLRIGVLVNDFGDINIDAELIETATEDIVSLSNGCICCSIREDLLDSVWGLLERPDRPDCLIVEASGVADPSAIAFTFSAPGVRESARLDAVITVVDCEQVFEPRPEPVQQLLLDQMKTAHIVVMNKTDLIEKAALEKVSAWVREQAPSASTIKAVQGKVPSALLLDFQTGRPIAPASTVKPIFITKRFSFDTPIGSFRAFNYALQQLPDGVLRVKGVLYLADMPARRVILQRVGKRTDIRPGRPWGEARPCSHIVCIATSGTSLEDIRIAW